MPVRERCPELFVAGDFSARCTRQTGHEGEHRKAPPGTPLRSVRLPDDVWHAAVKQAKAEGSSVSAWVLADLQKRLKRRPSVR